VYQRSSKCKLLEAFIAKNGPDGKKRKTIKSDPDEPKVLTMHQKFMSETMLKLKIDEPKQKDKKECMLRASAMWNTYKESDAGKLAVAEYQAERLAIIRTPT
jgi:hypothetical protein